MTLDLVNTGSEYHSVEPSDGEPTIELPTVGSADAWNETTDENPNVDRTAFVRSDDADPPCDEGVNDVTLVVNQSTDSYDLRVTKLSLDEPSKTAAE